LTLHALRVESTAGRATATEVPRLRNSRRELAGVETRSEPTRSPGQSEPLRTGGT
jgi:hypothetical protein